MAASSFNEKVIDEFRANGGEVERFAAVDLLLLTTTGAKSGQARTSPLAYQRSGDDFVVAGTYEGRSVNPQWVHNVRAHPAVTVEVGTETFPATARVTEGEERTRIWEAQKAAMPQLVEYEEKAGREIPVVVISRASSSR